MSTIRIAFISDTHFEHVDNPWPLVDELCTNIEFFGCDYLILPGDISNIVNVVEILCYMGGRLDDIAIIYTPGNHELYGTKHFHNLFDLVKRATPINVHILHRSYLYDVSDDVLIVGAPGWIDGSWGNIYNSRNNFYKKRYNDFRMIPGFGKHGQEYGQADYRAFDKLLANEAGRKIAVTHMLPSPECIVTKYLGEPLNHCYANDWSDLMKKHNVDLWLFGHSHSRTSTEVNGTCCMSNCAGYPSDHDYRLKVQIKEI